MIPNKTLIAIVGIAMIGVLLYPPVIGYVPHPSGFTFGNSGGHEFIWGLGGFDRPDILRIALYEVAIAGVGALIHFLTRK